MKTVLYVGASLDGFIARKDGDIDWLSPFESKEVFASFNEFMRTIDAILIGRKTYERVLPFPTWPYTKKVFVLSTSVTQPPAKLKGKVTFLSMKPAEVLDYLSKAGFSKIYVDGGQVIRSFLKDDLIDEMIITRVPVLIGSGISLFGTLDKDLSFEHKNTDIYSNGLVKSRYERKRK